MKLNPSTYRRIFAAPLLPILAALVALAGLIPCMARAADAPKKEPSPVELIDGLSQQVITLLADKTMPAKDKRQKIQDIAYANIDFPTLSQLTLGAQWHGLSEVQRADFMKEYRTHLANTYRSMIDNYNNEQVKTLGDREEPRGDRTVITKVTDPKTNDEFKVDYRVRHKPEGWKIIDITIEGVSLAANFRAQFAEIMNNGGFEQLMKMLRAKNAAAEQGHDDTPKGPPTPKSGP